MAFDFFEKKLVVGQMGWEVPPSDRVTQSRPVTINRLTMIDLEVLRKI